MATVLKHALGYKEVRQVIESSIDLSSRLPQDLTFLKAIMKTWMKLHSVEPLHEADIQRQPIWNNRHPSTTEACMLDAAEECRDILHQ